MDPTFLFKSTIDTSPRRASAAPDLAGSASAAAPAPAGISPAAPAAFAPAAGAAGLVPPSSSSNTIPAVGASGLTTGFGGGLASSPNVPAPGTTINPATGLPHTAGLTRAELQAQKARADEGRRLSELSGKEQAAAQLLGPGAVGLQSGATAAPGQANPTVFEDVVQDVTQSISKLGHKTYDALPAAVKDVFAEPKGKGIEGTPVKPRRGSAAALFDNVKSTASRISHEIQQTVSEVMADPPVDNKSPTARKASLAADNQPPAVNADTTPSAATGRRESLLKPTTGRTSNTIGSETSVLQHVKEFFQDAMAPATGGVAGGPLVKNTLPSQENQGARPGEVSAGAGALPGVSSEAGVAVPPEVRKQEGTDGGKITHSNAAASRASVSGPAGPLPLPTPVTVPRDGGAFGAMAFTGTVGEKSGLESALDGISERAKGLFAFASTAAAGAGGVRADLSPDVEAQNARVSGLKGDAAPAASTVSEGSILPSNTAAGASAPGVVPSTGTGATSGPATTLASDSKTTGDAPAALAPAESESGGKESALAAGAAVAAGAVGTGAALSHSHADDSKSKTTELAPPISTTETNTSSTAASSHAPSTVGPSDATTTDKTASASASASGATAPPNDRTDSLASVTAIRHGQSGDRHAAGSSPLATVASSGEPATPASASASASASTEPTTEQKSTTRGTGPAHVSSLTPGKEEDGVGHPSSRDSEGATRGVGSYPAAQHDDGDGGAKSESKTHTHTPPDNKEKDVVASPRSHMSGTTLGASPAAPAHKGLASGENGNGHGHGNGGGHEHDATKSAAAAPAGGANETAHRRNSSNASSDSKKVGFMKKLKGEIKVISGKIGRDEEKVQLGEKIKHGEA